MLGFVPQTPLTTTEGTSLRVNPSDTLREQHFAYAGEPLRVAPLALCRGTRPPQWLTVHRKCFTATEWLPNLQFVPILGLKTLPSPYRAATPTRKSKGVHPSFYFASKE